MIFIIFDSRLQVNKVKTLTRSIAQTNVNLAFQSDFLYLPIAQKDSITLMSLKIQFYYEGLITFLYQSLKPPLSRFKHFARYLCVDAKWKVGRNAILGYDEPVSEAEDKGMPKYDGG